MEINISRELNLWPEANSISFIALIHAHVKIERYHSYRIGLSALGDSRGLLYPPYTVRISDHHLESRAVD